jgi:hypothetical protein
MRRHQYAAALLGTCLVLMASTLDGGQPLRMHLSPAISIAPGYLTVRVSIESAAENRILQVVAEPHDFYRSSQVSLDGANAAPLSVFEFRNLPSGLYDVTGVLVGVNGPRASVSGLAKVQPAAGR